ncbi:50S ribosomal protein L2 [Candidatus Dependentiae bacterium]|nr:50S ribosomal protein L2 [Candidatus Dependentiae bacterium]
MAIVKRKPRNSSLRAQQFICSKDLTKKAPEKSLTAPLPKTGGRNAYGRITVRHRGGGAKRLYRLVDFKRVNKDVEGTVRAFEYDPNRNVSIALIVYKSGAKSYMLRPDNLRIGDTIMASAKAEAKVGNSLPLKSIPVGFFVHNVELYPGQGGKFARSAGTSVQLVAREDERAILKMPSGEVRTIGVENWATVGTLSNADYRNISLGKAGRTRHRGWRPSVRGMAMNPVDHPHGGGEGRSKSGAHPVTPWGKCCKGARTRKRKNSAILKRRKK